jgi:Flp pilus assembly protein TadD
MLNIGRVQDAEAEFQKAVELDPTYADAYHNLGSAYAE